MTTHQKKDFTSFIFFVKGDRRKFIRYENFPIYGTCSFVDAFYEDWFARVHPNFREGNKNVFWWIELHGKALPVPKTNIIACSLLGVLSIVSDALWLLVAVYRMLLLAFIHEWACVKNFGLKFAELERCVFTTAVRVLYLQPCLRVCVQYMSTFF